MLRLLSTVLVAATLGVLSPAGHAEAQPWIRPAGDAYVNVNYRYLTANQFFTSDGDRVPSADFRQHALGLYGELGVVDRWLMLTVDGDLFRRNVLPGQGAITGLGDIRLGAWTGILELPVRLSAGVLVGLPTGDSAPSAGPNADPIAQITARSLPTGDGETDVTLATAIGHGFRVDGTSLEMFVQGLLGYAIRTTGFTDQLVYRAEVGARIRENVLERFLLIVRFNGAELFGSPANVSGVAGVGDGIRFTTFAPELFIDVHEGFGLGIGGEVPLRATNLPAGPLLKLSASYTVDN